MLHRKICRYSLWRIVDEHFLFTTPTQHNFKSIISLQCPVCLSALLCQNVIHVQLLSLTAIQLCPYQILYTNGYMKSLVKEQNLLHVVLSLQCGYNDCSVKQNISVTFVINETLTFAPMILLHFAILV